MGTFYATLATISFTLLGLWWVVVQARLGTWVSSRARRIGAYSVSGHFVAVGLLALLATMEDEVDAIWRIGALGGGLLGLVATGVALRYGEMERYQRLEEVLILAAFLVVISLSAFTYEIGDLQAIEVNAVASVVIMGLSTQLAWQFLLEAARDDR